jgi:hypothetical protein
MKICVIGNSHSAALKSASSSKSIEGVDFDYFVRPGGDQPRVALEDGRIWPISMDGTRNLAASNLITTVEGAATNGLDLSPYAGVVISACGLFAARNININAQKNSHPLGYLSCADWLEESQNDAPGGNQIVSAAVFGLAVESHVRAHPSMQLALVLSEYFPGPVYLQPSPAPSRTLKRNPRWFLNAWYGKRGPEAWFAFFEAQWMAVQTVARELSSQSILLNYPLAEPLKDGFMQEAWFDRDPWHSNGEYGKLVLDQFAKRIASEQP